MASYLFQLPCTCIGNRRYITGCIFFRKRRGNYCNFHWKVRTYTEMAWRMRSSCSIRTNRSTTSVRTVTSLSLRRMLNISMNVWLICFPLNIWSGALNLSICITNTRIIHALTRTPSSWLENTLYRMVREHRVARWLLLANAETSFFIKCLQFLYN